MGYQRVMYLMSLLYQHAGSAQEEVFDIYKQSVKGTEEYQALSKLLMKTEFWGHDGKQLHNQCAASLNNSLNTIDNALDNLQEIQFSYEKTKRSVDGASELLASPRFFDDEIVAINAEDTVLYRKFYFSLANAICYYMLSQFGIDAVKNLSYDRSIDLPNLIRLINQQYVNELMRVSENKKARVWKISKVNYAGIFLLKGSGYNIEYSNEPIAEMSNKVSTGEYRRIAPYLYVNRQGKEKDLYVGCGNIVGVDIGESLSLLNSQIVTSLKIGAFSTHQQFDFMEPISEISTACNTSAFCISPEDFASALNRWSTCRNAVNSKSRNRCLFCDSGVPGQRIVCEQHFSVNS